MNKYLFIVLGAVLIALVGMVSYISGFLPPFTLPFAIVLFALYFVFALRK